MVELVEVADSGGDLGGSGHDVDLSILVVSWRTREHLRTLIQTLDVAIAQEMDGWKVEVVVVDNASGDGTAEMLRDEFDRKPFRVITSTVNTGYSGGNNLAFACSHGDVIVIANPDLILKGDQIVALAELLRLDPSIGVVTAELIGRDGRRQHTSRSLPRLSYTLLCLTRIGKFIDHRVMGARFTTAYHLRHRPSSGRYDIEQAAGALLVFRRDLVTQVNGYLFDEDMPIVYSDVDLSKRVWDSGMRVVLDADVRVSHVGGASLDQLGKNGLARRDWEGLRSYYQKHGSGFERLVISVLAGWYLRHLKSVATSVSTDDGTRRPLVSIVIISYNYAHYLDAAISSALAQQFPDDEEHPDVEVIVVDDGSTDDTGRVAASFANMGVRYMRKPNGGLSQARNFGARHASGEYIVFLDADDLLHPTMVALCLAAIRSSGADFAFSQVRFFGDEDRVTDIEGWDVERLKHENYLHPAFLMRRVLALDHPYDEANRIGWEDWDFLLQIAKSGATGVLVDECLVDYRRHSSNMTVGITGLTKRRQRKVVLRRHIAYVGVRRWLAAEVAYVRMWLGVKRRSLFNRLRNNQG